jgi:hypothetical protein
MNHYIMPAWHFDYFQHRISVFNEALDVHEEAWFFGCQMRIAENFVTPRLAVDGARNMTRFMSMAVEVDAQTGALCRQYDLSNT